MDRSRFAITVCRPGGGGLLWVLLLAVVVGVLPGRSSQAQDDDLFQVLGIRVDETDQTAAAARTKALAVGERRAWEILVQRLVDPAQRAKMSALPQAGDAVKDFWVTDEKTSAVRYIATLNYNFRPDAVKRLLAGRSARFATTRSKPVLVVPLVAAIGEPPPATMAAAWREAWRGASRGRGLVPMRLSSDDSSDAGVVAIDPAPGVDRSRLSDLARRNGSDEALITVATLVTGTEAAGRHLKVTSTRYAATGAGQPLPEKTFPLGPPDTDATVLGEAAAAVVQDVETIWRRSNAVSTKPVSRTLVRVPTLTLEDWVAMRRRLIELPQAERVQVLAVDREYATVAISYPGGTEDLAAALSRRGLALHNDNGRWLVAEATALPPGEEIPILPPIEQEPVMAPVAPQ
ncbi:MAG TPA: hypothetical protein VES39_09900 [Rhodospirillales bacterium]|nr:hypothetical protein [Rhodospirillales bacterium]